MARVPVILIMHGHRSREDSNTLASAAALGAKLEAFGQLLQDDTRIRILPLDRLSDIPDDATGKIVQMWAIGFGESHTHFPVTMLMGEGATEDDF